EVARARLPQPASADNLPCQNSYSTIFGVAASSKFDTRCEPVTGAKPMRLQVNSASRTYGCQTIAFDSCSNGTGTANGAQSLTIPRSPALSGRYVIPLVQRDPLGSV